MSLTLAALLEDVHQRGALLADLNSISAIVGLLNSPNEGTQQNAAKALAALAEGGPSCRDGVSCWRFLL